MPRKLPLHVTRQRTRHGKIVFYFRIGKGKRHRLPDITAPDFMETYQRFLAGNITPAKHRLIQGSLKWLVEIYLDSGKFNGLAENTKKNRRNILMAVANEHPNFSVAEITSPNIRLGMEKRTPSMANNYLKAMSHMFKWAVSVDHVKVNPCAGVSKINYNREDAPIWEEPDLALYRQKWPTGTNQRLAMEIMYHCGLALADACRLGKMHIKGSMIEIARKKTGVTQYIPITDQVQTVLDMVPKGNMVFLLTSYGKPFTPDGLGNMLLNARRKAKIGEYCESHGLRRKRAVDLAEGGATALQLMSIMGWEDIKEAELYTKRADKRKLAISGSKSLTLRSGEGKY
jgi:site-specific recombinase XerD